MNCILFKNKDDLLRLDFKDSRACHIKKYLKPKNGDEIFVGIVNEKISKAKIFERDSFYEFEILDAQIKTPILKNIEVAVAMSRPQIAQSILFEAACLGIKKLTFYAAEKSDSSYAKSSLYTEDYKKYLIQGAEQACTCFIPEVEIAKDLEDYLKNRKAQKNEILFAPDNYEFEEDLKTSRKKAEAFSLVLGAERGFNSKERELLREHNFKLVSLGDRVLRTDSAFIFSIALLS